MRSVRLIAVVAGLLVALAAAQSAVAAFDSSISTSAIERALSIARSSASERAHFHRPYIIDVNGPVVDSVAVERIEIITEFRRMELIGEDQVGVGASFGRAGFKDAIDALKPWRNRVTVVVRLRCAFPVQSTIRTLPPIHIRLEGDRPITPLTTDDRVVTSNHGPPISGTVEAVFAADALASNPMTATVDANGRALDRVRIDLRAVE